MDRVSSSMRQAANPLPRVLSRRAGGSGPEAERESFERAQVRAGRSGRVVPPRGAGTEAGVWPHGWGALVHLGGAVAVGCGRWAGLRGGCGRAR